MSPGRRIGATDSTTRAQLLDAAEQLLLEEGYAAVTSRRIGARAGLKAQLVHYYFRTMDDLFLEVFRRRADQRLERHAAALDDGQPLRALWEISVNPVAAAFNIEFAALANHRKSIRGEIARYAERFREMHVATVARVLAERGVEGLSPVVAMLALTGVSQVIGIERAMGITGGHDETIAFVEQQLVELEGAPGGAAQPS